MGYWNIVRRGLHNSAVSGGSRASWRPGWSGGWQPASCALPPPVDIFIQSAKHTPKLLCLNYSPKDTMGRKSPLRGPHELQMEDCLCVSGTTLKAYVIHIFSREICIRLGRSHCHAHGALNALIYKYLNCHSVLSGFKFFKLITGVWP